jgi:hypothetical protein
MQRNALRFIVITLLLAATSTSGRPGSPWPVSLLPSANSQQVAGTPMPPQFPPNALYQG